MDPLNESENVVHETGYLKPAGPWDGASLAHLDAPPLTLHFLYEPFDTADAVNYKVTGGASYDAAEVEFKVNPTPPSPSTSSRCGRSTGCSSTSPKGMTSCG